MFPNCSLQRALPELCGNRVPDGATGCGEGDNQYLGCYSPYFGQYRSFQGVSPRHHPHRQPEEVSLPASAPGHRGTLPLCSCKLLLSLSAFQGRPSQERDTRNSRTLLFWYVILKAWHFLFPSSYTRESSLKWTVLCFFLSLCFPGLSSCFANEHCIQYPRSSLCFLQIFPAHMPCSLIVWISLSCLPSSHCWLLQAYGWSCGVVFPCIQETFFLLIGCFSGVIIQSTPLPSAARILRTAGNPPSWFLCSLHPAFVHGNPCQPRY